MFYKKSLKRPGEVSPGIEWVLLRLPSRLGECLVDVGNQIVNVFDTDGQPDHIGADARRFQLLIVQLTMSC